jgi:hypothetical protein
VLTAWRGATVLQVDSQDANTTSTAINSALSNLGFKDKVLGGAVTKPNYDITGKAAQMTVVTTSSSAVDSLPPLPPGQLAYRCALSAACLRRPLPPAW